MTNPNNAVGTNAGYNGRTTPNAFNDVLGVFDIPGIVSGWECTPKSGMTVQIGGGDVRDVAVAEDASGNRVTINNRLGTPIEVTLPGAPATGSRYDTIVAYVSNPIDGEGAADVDFPSQTGLIVVSGTVAANPTYPTPTQINDAITADGADGPNAYQVQLCSILVGQGVTTIGSGAIEGGTESTISLISLDEGAVDSSAIQDGAITSDKIDTTGGWTAGTYASGYTVSSNAGYIQGIQACIYNGFLIVRFGVSKTSGSFAADSEVTIGTIPSEIDGVDVSTLISGSAGKKNIYRTSVSGAGGADGFCQISGLNISVTPQSTASWLTGQFIIPLNW